MRIDLNQQPGSDLGPPPPASPTFTAPLVGHHDEIRVTLDLDGDGLAEGAIVNPASPDQALVVQGRESSRQLAKKSNSSGRQTACVSCYFSERKVGSKNPHHKKTTSKYSIARH